MREIRPSGSEGGETGQPVFPTPIDSLTASKRNDPQGLFHADADVDQHQPHATPDSPIGLDYVAGAVRRSGGDVELVDLNLRPDADAALADHFRHWEPDLVGLTFRNADDCFWPSGESFVPVLQPISVCAQATNAPIVLGGVGYSIFPQSLVACSEADFGICGDGEDATEALLAEVRGQRRWERVPGLVYRQDGVLRPIRLPGRVDCRFPRRATASITRRISARRADRCRNQTRLSAAVQLLCRPARQGRRSAARSGRSGPGSRPLADRGLDVLHVCDAEFNLPPEQRWRSDAMIARHLVIASAGTLTWQSSRFPTNWQSASPSRLIGINFTSDSTHPKMLATYRQPHRRKNLAQTVAQCEQGIAVMLDLLLGGPGETPETVADTVAGIQSMARIAPVQPWASASIPARDGDAGGGGRALEVNPGFAGVPQVGLTCCGRRSTFLRRWASGRRDWSAI